MMPELDLTPDTTAATRLSWYVVHSRPQQELRALQNLQQQGFTVFLPVIRREVLRQRTLRQQQEPLFKRYLFIQFDAEHSPWHVIRNTLGVTDLVRFGGRPAVIPDAVIHNLQAMQQPEQALFSTGERLLVTEGPFKDLEVIFQMRDGEERAMVLLQFMHKTHQLRLELHTLKKAV